MYAEERRSKENTPTPGRLVLAKKSAVGGGDVQLGDEANNPPASQNEAKSSYSCVNNNDSSRGSHHNDVKQRTADLDDVKLTLPADRNPSDGCRIKKSVSFRAESKRPSGNAADGDRHVISGMYRSLPRPRQPTCQRKQHDIADAPQTSPNTRGSGRDWLSVKAVLRDLNNKQDSGSRRSQSCGPSKRSACASGPMTQADTGVAEVLNYSSGSCNSTERSVDYRLPSPRAGHRRRHPTSINWFVDLTDVASTELRQPMSLGTCGLRQSQGDCRIGAESKPSMNAVNDGKKLEPEPLSRTTRREASGRRGRAATRSTLDQQRRHDATETTNTAVSTSTSALTEIGGKSTPPRRTWSPKASRTSELQTSKPAGSEEDPVFQRSNASQFRRSTTRPKYPEVFTHDGSAVNPAERDASWGLRRRRSVSLSEQYRMLIGGDWFDKFATSSSVANQQKLTPDNGYHSPLAMSRQLKPDFVIYV